MGGTSGAVRGEGERERERDRERERHYVLRNKDKGRKLDKSLRNVSSPLIQFFFICLHLLTFYHSAERVTT